MTKKPARLTLLMALLLAAGCAQLPEGALTTLDTNSPVTTWAAAPAALPTTSSAASTAPDQRPTPVPAAQSPAAETATLIQAPPRDIWERIRRGFVMRPMDNALVGSWETRYTAKPDYLARMTERGGHYLHHIVEEIERRKMPAEIALLPMIESAYNPQAYSKAHASGLWQFIPSTGKLYGLRQNWWYDGRRDVIAATHAALDYLEKLYNQFGDWELALASYNWGEGAVSRAIARNQAKGLPTDYASLTMPAETRHYLPKLIAVKNIISDPARFGVQLTAVPNEPYFATVAVQRHIDVKLAAKFSGMPLAEFKFLNPAHNKAVIKAGTAETIVLPRDRVTLFESNLQNHDAPLVSWQAHTLKAGEQPEKIAARYGISMAELKQVNGINGNHKFRTGQSLLVPVKAGATPYLPDLPATPVTLAKAYQAARDKNAAKKSGKKVPVQSKATKPAPAQRVKAIVKPAPAKSAVPKKTAATVVAAQNTH